MDDVNTEVPRWVIQHVDVEAIRYAKTMAARHDVRMAEVIEQAIYHLWDEIAEGGELPPHWKDTLA